MMIINREMLRTDKPEKKILDDGCVNCVLALWSEDVFCDSNLYLPRWTICNVSYYLAHIEEFDGWIEIENILLPEKFWAEKEATKEQK